MKLLHALPPYNLFGIEEQDYGSAKVVALPVPYDSTVSYGTGTRHGPHAIIEASRSMELYSEALGWTPSSAGVYTTEELEPDMGSPERTVARIAREAELIISDGKMPLVLGGEHTVALGPMNALKKLGRKFSVLHFDAHSDSRDEFMGTKYSHACVMARARELADRCYSIGVRSISEEDAKDKSRSKDTLYMKDMQGMGADEIAKRACAGLGDDIYITIDLDVLDPAEMPSVGTPEPAGMRYAELTAIIGKVLERKKLLGFDITELSPIPGLAAPNYLAAKLAYHVIGCALKGQEKT